MRANLRRKTRGPAGTDNIDNISVPRLLRALAHIASHGGVDEAELREVTRLSRASNYRLLAYARVHLGVVISWHGEYAIEDWGVFDSRRVRAWARQEAKR